MKTRQNSNDHSVDEPLQQNRRKASPQAMVKAEKLRAHDAKVLLQTPRRTLGLARQRDIVLRRALAESPKPQFPRSILKAKRAKLTDLKIDEPVSIDGFRYVVHRLTYKDGFCIAELRDCNGARLLVGEGRVYAVTKIAGIFHIRFKTVREVRRPEMEANYV
jgi:hypothetical protein